MKVGGEDGELVAADAGDGIGLAKLLAQVARHLDEHVVAGTVAEDVVDLLEAVDVEEDDRAGKLRPARLDEGQFELLEERAAVEETGERIGAGETDELGLALLALDGVADGAQQRPRLDLRLFEVVAGAVFQRLGGDLQVGQAGEHDDGGVGHGAAQRTQSVEAERVRQAEIKQDRIGRVLAALEVRQREAQRIGGMHATVDRGVARAVAERDLGQAPIAEVVLDQQHRQTGGLGVAHARSAECRGLLLELRNLR